MLREIKPAAFLEKLATLQYLIMGLIKVIEENNCILTEASVIEKLRRSEGIRLHPRLENALLLYDAAGSKFS